MQTYNLTIKLLLAILCVNVTVASGQDLNDTQQNTDKAPLTHHKKEGYKNTAPDFKNDTAILPILWRYITEKRVDPTPTKNIPVRELTTQQLNNLSQDSVIRLGHSTIYMHLSGQKWLIDPVFSERASPFSFIGPKRFHQPPIALDDLPDLDGVIISHDHYDHLDEDTIKRLAKKVKTFIVPLGVDKYLVKWGVPKASIKALDWWQSISFDNVTVTATPTQHFSGRGLFDKDETLWASYVIQSESSSVYFSGDSGYFDGFKQIGEKYGPFDLTMIETGAYDRNWETIHMLPEESLQAHIDLKGKHLMPIHNGTFDLAFHGWREPFERISAAAAEKGVMLSTPIMGQIISINSVEPTQQWWKN